jgi:GTP cyclohydrolase II
MPPATMLSRMGIQRVRLMTNNPEKIAQLERYGIEVAARVPHSFPSNGHNENYLRTKAERAGHLL